MDQHYIEKQDIFCSYCMDIDLPKGNWGRYRFINNQLVQHNLSKELLSSIFSICCFYQKPYASFKGKSAIIQLLNNYKQIKALNACLGKIDDMDYLRVLYVLEEIKKKYPKVVIYCPQKNIKGWKRYKVFLLQPIAERFNSFDIRCYWGPADLPNINADAIAILELSSDAKSIDNNINEIVSVYKQKLPALLYISFFTEVSKDGKIEYFKKEEIGKLFR